MNHNCCITHYRSRLGPSIPGRGRGLFRPFWLLSAAAAIWFCAIPAARAGLSLQIDIIHNCNAGVLTCAPNLSLNSNGPDATPITYHEVYSPNTNFTGGVGTNSFNNRDDHPDTDFASFIQAVTNGVWTLVMNVGATNEHTYHFTVSAPNLSSNRFVNAQVDFPWGGGTVVDSLPTFVWHGPTNADSQFIYVANSDFSVFQYDFPSVTTTSESLPPALANGDNYGFNVNYTADVSSLVTVTTPLDESNNPAPGWVSTSRYDIGAGANFRVFVPPVIGAGTHTLVAHYTFDNGGDLGHDSSPSDNSIQCSSSWRSSHVHEFNNDAIAGGGAAEFFGESSLTLCDQAFQHVTDALLGSFSVSAWIKTTNVVGSNADGGQGTGQSVFEAGDGVSGTVPIAITGTKVAFYTHHPVQWGSTLHSTNDVTTGEYVQIVATRDQSTGQRSIYINGVLDSSDIDGTGPLSGGISYAAIGGDLSSPYSGLADDVQIYAGILNPTEVATLYQHPGTPAPNVGPAYIPLGGHTNIAHYAFEDSGNLGQDSSGKGNDMTSGGWWGPVHQFNADAAAGGGAIQFFGTSEINPNDQALTNLNGVLAGSFTFSAWVKTTVTNGADYNNAFFGSVVFWAYNDHGDTNDTIPISITGSKAAFTTRDHLGNFDTLHSGSSVNDGNYHLITVTRDAVTGEKRIYVDGNFETSEFGTTEPLNGNNYFLSIGGAAYWIDDTGTNFSSYTGLLDDVQIYSGVLSDTEVVALFGNPGTTIPDVAGGSTGLMVHYDFDEGTALAADVSGNGNHLVHAGNFGGSGPSASSEAKAGSGSVSFDGGSYLTASSNLLATLAGDFTVSLWLKTSQNFGSQNDYAWAGAGIISADSPLGGAKDLVPVALTGGQVAFNVGDGDVDDTLNSSATVNDSIWHHVVVTRSQSTGQRQIYIDGTLDSSKGGTTRLLNDPVLLTIGAKSDASNSDPSSPDYNGSNGYDGLLDDIQIYARVLNSNEVAFLYHSPGAPIPGSAPALGAALNTSGLTWTTGGAANWFVETTNTYDGVSAVQSGLISDGQTNWIQTTVPYAGQFSFFWQVSSEGDWDYLTFYINGVEQDAISGLVGWNQKTYFVSAGDVLRWEYTKDPFCCAADLDAGFLDQVSYILDNSRDFNAALGTTNRNWTVLGDGHWFTENTNTHDGYFAAQSSATTDTQDSRLLTQVTGPVSISFWWNVLNGDGNNNLAFVVDGNYYWDIISGDQGYWTQDSFVIGPGVHTLMWRYYKYGSASTNDAGFLDQVSISDQVSPQITRDISNITVQAGSNAVLNVQLYANPPATIVWNKNGTVITNATSSTLTITNAQLSDSGNYQMIASNSVGTAYSATVAIRVFVPTDLQPLSLTAPLVVGSQTSVPVTWLATNTGPGAVSGWYDYLFFETNNSVLYFLGSGTLQPSGRQLPAAASYSISNLFGIPAVPAGNYSLLVSLDYGSNIIETNETNNTLAIPITVVNPDLQPTDFRVAGGIGGQPLRVVWTVVNHGPGLVENDYLYYYQRHYWYDRFYLSTNSVWDATAIPIGAAFYAAQLAAGDHITQTNVFTLPPAPSGDYYVILRVDPDGYIKESTKTNNDLSLPLHLTVPDLVPTNLIAPAVASSGQSVSFQWMAQNQGNAVATNTYAIYDGYQWYDTLFLSTNQQSSGRIAWLWSYTPWYSVLAPGQAMTNSQTLTFPGVPQGNYYVVLAVDYGNNVMEVNETNNSFAQPIQVLNPDLVPISLTAPATAEARSTFQVTWQVANQGAADAFLPNWPWRWEDYLYISTNSTWDSHALNLGYADHSQAIPSGTNYVQSLSVTLPGFAAGSYYLILSVDEGNYLYESNKTNNYRSIPISISSPDLAAVSLTAPTNASSQQPITAFFSASNVGGVAAPAGWADRLYLSPDGIPGTNNLGMIDATWNTPLPAGNTYTQLMNTAIPAVPAGNYYLLLDVDGNRFFAENNLANNYLAQPIHIANPDLFPTNFTAPVSVVVTQLSQRFEADWMVVNQGAGAAYTSWGDYLYLSTTNVLDSSAVYVGSAYRNPVLAPGQAYLGFANVQLPDGIQGNFYLILQANAYGSLYESTQTNNILVRPVQLVVPPVPILSLISVQSPGDAWSGTDIQVSWVLTNTGSAALEGTFYDQVSLASDAAGQNPRPFGTFQFTGRINPGQSVLRQQRISLPLNFSGLFWVEVQTDLYHNIFEFLSRTNDTLVASQPLLVHLTPTPNLIVASVQAPTNIFSSDQAVISWVVTNTGTGPTRAPYWYDSVYLSGTTNINNPIYIAYLGQAENASFLDSGDSYANSLTVTIPRGIDGTYYFIVTANANNSVFEGTNKNDNVLASGPVTVNLTPTPDLQVRSVIAPHDAFSGQTYPIEWGVTNFGLGQTGPRENDWWDQVYLSTNNFLDASAISLGRFEHRSGLDPNAGYRGSNSVALPVGISGNWYFIVQCDVYNQVFEGAFEDNNSSAATYSTRVVLTPPPDLVATLLQSPSNALSGHYLGITYAVGNYGSTITPNSVWYDNLYLSTSPVFDPGHALLFATAQHYGPLALGATYTNVLGAVLPDTYTGTNYLFILSDAYNYVFELNKSNNHAAAASPVAIVSRPADLAVTSLQAPPSANAGSAILVSWAVTNQGVGDTAIGYWHDRLILSQNSILGAPSDVVLVDVTHNDLLGAAGSYSATNQFAAIPGGLSPGTYKLFLVTDSYNQVYEGTNENNNLYGPVPITITAHAADLQITAASAPTNAVSGSSVLVQWTEKNGGDLSPNSSSWLDAVYITRNGLLDADAILLGYNQNPTNLFPGTSYTNSLSVALPSNLQSNYYFVVVADGWNQVLEPGLKGNNVAVITPPIFITLNQVADLAVTSVNAPADAYSGQNFTLSWTVQNQGSATAGAPWYDAVYLSLDQFLDPAHSIYLGYAYHFGNLTNNASYTNTAAFSIPQGLSGPYYVFVTADYGQNVYERGSRVNNTADAPHVTQVHLTPPVDLVAGTITIPVNGVPGQNATVTYSVFNQGSNTALGTWQDALYVSANTNWDISDPLFARVQHSGDVPPGSGYTNTVTAPLPGLLPGDYYLIVRSDILNHLSEANRSNNITASLNAVGVDVQTITLGTPIYGTLLQGQSAFYRFYATNGCTIRIRLTSTDSLSGNELFLRQGQMPTSGQFDFAANDPFVSDPEIFVPITASGTYYLLAYGEYTSISSSYNLLAEVLPFTISEVQPTYAGDAGATTFKVRGALFDSQTRFQLVNPSNTVPASGVLLEDSSTAYVTFDAAGAADGLWSLQAILNPTNPIVASLSNAITVIPGNGPQVDVSIDGALAVDFRFPHAFQLYYGNSGDADAQAPLVLVAGAGGTRVGTQLGALGGSTVELLGRSLEGPSSLLRPQTSQSQTLYFFGGHVQAWAVTADSTRPLTESDWQDIEASVRPPGIADANWQAFWSNIRPRVGVTWGDYVQFLNRIALSFPAEQRDVRAMITGLYNNQPGFRASATLAGVLLGSTNGLPQPGITVGFYQTNAFGGGQLGGSAITDGSGNFIVPNIQPGQYQCFIANSDVDMDRDGVADNGGPVIVVPANGDPTNVTLYLYQSVPPQLPTLDADATLKVDTQGMLHAFWFRDGSLWHARNQAGAWIEASPISVGTNLVNEFAVGNGASLLDGKAPGMILVWSQPDTNGTEIFYSVGQNTNAGYQWSQPKRLTADALQNSSPAVVVRGDGTALITYLKQDPTIRDDTDVYFSLVNVASGALIWNAPAASIASKDLVTKQSFEWEFSKGFKPFNYAFTLAAGLKGEFVNQDCKAEATVGGFIRGQIDTDKFRVWTKLSGDLSMRWDVDPDQCARVYNRNASKGNFHIELGAARKGIVYDMLGLYPPTKPFALALEEFMAGFEGYTGYDFENNFEFTLTGDLKGVVWPDAPLASFGVPLGLDSAESSFSVALKFSAAPTADIRFRRPSAANSPSAAAGVQIVFTTQFFPEWKPLTMEINPSVEFSIWGFKYSPPLEAIKIALSGIPAPQSRTPFDLLSGTLTYDPASAVGTPNVYGANAVLSNVAGDLYDDGAPALALDSSGIPYQVWCKDNDPFDTAHLGSQLVVADYNRASWSAPQVIPQTLGFNSHVTAGTDSLGKRMVVWVHGDSNSLTTSATPAQFFGARRNVDVYYSIFDGSGWSVPQPIATTPGADAGLHVSHMTGGNILAVWTYTDTNSVSHLVSSYWNGFAWATPEEIASGQISRPTAQQVGDTTYLFWTQIVGSNRDKSLFESRNVGGVWSKPNLFAPTLVAPAATLASAPALAQPQGVTSFLFGPIPKKCCQCQGKTTTAVTNGAPTKCGVAEQDYDYEHCHKVFQYVPCGRASGDPNDITGPIGFGPQKWVTANDPLKYVIQFENDPAIANAPARQVRITLPLDPNFDPRTFRLGSFGFGGMTFQVPPNSAFYQTRLDFTATNGFYVDVFAGVDVAAHQAFWTFTTIDPKTGDLSDNVLLGFLPVDSTPPQGEGFVSCSVLPLAGVTTGAKVAAQATIVFDNQPPLATPVAANTLEAGTPVSSVLPLPSVSALPVFNVAWQGASAPGGSGIASFDVYVSQDGGRYSPWLQGATLSQAPYVGQAGSTFAFYSIAHDNAGNVQPTPAQPDTFTYVSTNLPPSILPITNVVVAPGGSVFLRIAATDPNGDAVTYSLGSGAPAGATINEANGLFRWKPGRPSAETASAITVVATDNGVPPMSTNATFLVTVLDYLELALGSTNLEGGQSASLPIVVSSDAGVTNLVFAVQVPETVLSNWSLTATSPQVASADLQDLGTNIVISLSTSPSQPLQGTQQVAQLNFSAAASGVSSFVTLPIVNVAGFKPNAAAYGNVLTHAGSVAVVHEQPLLQASFSSTNARNLLLFGNLGANYQLQFTTNLLAPADWQTLLDYTQTNGVMDLSIPATNPTIFLRLHQK